MIGGAGLLGYIYHNIDSLKEVYKVDKLLEEANMVTGSSILAAIYAESYKRNKVDKPMTAEDYGMKPGDVSILTKREIFAAMAMQGMISNATLKDISNDTIALAAFGMADAMVERSKK